MKYTKETLTNILVRCFIVLTVFLPVSLTARGAGVAILPFRVTGTADPMYFSAADLPVLFQEATHFLFATSRDHAVQPVSETNRAMERVGFKGDMRLDEKKAAALCIETDA